MFPAYGDDGSWKKFQGNEQDSATPSCSYSSFKTVGKISDLRERRRKEAELEELEKKRRRREKLAKEEKKRQALSKYGIKMVSIDSDDDSEGLDISAENTRRLEDRHKRRKKKKRESSSSESSGDEKGHPSIAQMLSRDIEWSFLKPDWNPNVPSSFLVSDYKKVSANLLYDYLPRKEVPDYSLSLNLLVGGSDELNRVMFPLKEKIKKQKRYFADRVFKTWNDSPLKCKVLKNFGPISGYVPVDSVQLELQEPEDEVIDVTPVSNEISETEATPEVRSMLYNKRLKDDSQNVDLWLRFVAVQDEIYLEKCGVINAKKDGRKNCLTDKALLERKIDILDKAVQKNSQSVKLKLERIKIGRHLWDSQKLDREIRNVQFYHVNDPEMWTGVFDLIESDIRRFSFNKMLKLMQRAIEELSAVLRGDIITHPALPGTELYLVSIMIRMIRLMFDCGYSERAVGCAQAFCEYNLCSPKSFTKEQSKQKLEAFRVFWNSGIPRIGDEGAKGWAKSIDDLNADVIVTDKAETDKEDACREKEEFDYANSVDAKGEKRSFSKLWHYIEAFRLNRMWRPVRDQSIELDDNDRYVSIQHVQSMLLTLSNDAVLKFLFDVLNLFGASIYGREDVSVYKISSAFGTFPPHLFKRHYGFDEFIERFMEVTARYLPDHAAIIRCSLLITKCQFMLDSENIPQEKMFKMLRNEGKMIISKDPNNKSIWATFAEQLMKFGNREYPRKIAFSWLRQKKIWDCDVPERISLLRLAIDFTLVSDPNCWNVILGQLFVDGEITEKPTKRHTGSTVEKRYNQLLVEAIERKFTNWEGSEVDLLSTLILLYNARASDGSTHLKRIDIVHSSIRNNVQNQKLPVFMKHYVELLREHLDTHKNLSPKVLYMELRRLVAEFPKNIEFLKSLIDALCLGEGVYELQKLLSSPADDFIIETYRAFGLVYLELSRYRLQTICFEAQCHNVERLCHTLESTSNRLSHRYDIFWRLLLFIRSEREELEQCRETFYLSQSVCPWSKKLILDYVRMDPDMYITILTLMEEKCLRIHCQKEEVPLLGVS